MTKRLSLILVIKALLMGLLVLFAGIQLGPDEAQYWTWSRHLDLGYYSKPPMIAWQIFSGCLVFGQTELGVRAVAILLGTVLSFAIYFLAKEAQLSDRASFVAALAFALSPLGVLGTFFAITDTGMLLFWTLGLMELVRSMEGQPLRIERLGLWIALGALFKWPIYLLLPIAIWVYPQWGILRAVGISLLGLLPSLYWNWTHDFATFKHVSTIAQGGPDNPAKGNPLEFLGSQAALVSPLLFALLAMAWWKCGALLRDSQRFLGRLSLLIFAGFFAYAFFRKVQGNWALYLYPAAFVCLAAYWIDVKRRAGWIKASLSLSLVLLAFAFMVPSLTSHLPWRLNPFHHNLGWKELGSWVDRQPKGPFLCADKYQLTSTLSFYNGEQRQAYFLNLLGTRRNQFSYWPGPKEGEDALFFVVENGPHLEEKLARVQSFYPAALKKYFDQVGPPEYIPLVMVNEEAAKAAICYRCEKYKGVRPDEPEKY